MIRRIPILAVISLLFSCSASVKTEGNKARKTTETTSLTLAFENMAGNTPVHLDKDTFMNASGEMFTVSLLQYFISNISFKKTDGTVVSLPQDESYFLVKESDPASKQLSIPLPEGKYESVTFVLGVDSLRNTKPLAERTGVLDPATGAAGMYWSWNSGYIFFKMEGYSPATPQGKNNDHKFRYHIGLFGGMNTPTVNNVKTITLELPKIKLKGKKTPVIQIHTDILKMFSGKNTISIARNPTVMVSPFSAQIADNYASMFSVAGVN